MEDIIKLPLDTAYRNNKPIPDFHNSVIPSYKHNGKLKLIVKLIREIKP